MDIVNEEAKYFINCENKEKVLGYLIAVRTKYFFYYAHLEVLRYRKSFSDN